MMLAMAVSYPLASMPLAAGKVLLTAGSAAATASLCLKKLGASERPMLLRLRLPPDDVARAVDVGVRPDGEAVRERGDAVGRRERPGSARHALVRAGVGHPFLPEHLVTHGMESDSPGAEADRADV